MYIIAENIIFLGVYSKRFKGTSKDKTEGVGYKVPSNQEMDVILDGFVNLGNNVFLVNSSSRTVRYMTDMNVGFCQCKTGLNGSPCKHQFTIWVRKLASCTNFLPIFDRAHRQMYAEIAIGESASTESYEGLHDRILETPGNNGHEETTNENCGVSFLGESDSNTQKYETLQSRRAGLPELITAKVCEKTMKEVYSHVVSKLKCQDQNFYRSIMKFGDRLKRMPVSKLTRVFHTFGAEGVSNTRITATSIIKKAKQGRRGKIHVQPEAVKRRKNKLGSKSKISKGQMKIKNPFHMKAGKPMREHRFADNVLHNKAVSKKAGRTMATKTRSYESVIKSATKYEYS